MAGIQLDRTGVIVSCPQCGKSNRLRYDALGRSIRCGNCKTMLGAPAAPIEARDSTSFDALASSSAIPLLVDFWAAWCGPCRMVAPELERVARSNAGRYLVVKVDTEALTDVAARFRIQSIPTLALVDGGREIARLSGARPAAEIEAFVNKAIADDQPRAS
jgi:thioredoxin 2